jgi:hypothetical protein
MSTSIMVWVQELAMCGCEFWLCMCVKFRLALKVGRFELRIQDVL